MVELIIKNFLEKELNLQVSFERHKELTKPFILIEQISSSQNDHLPSKTLAFQSYGQGLTSTMILNRKLKNAVEKLVSFDEIVSVSLNSDYNFTDTSSKEYRYQAVFDIKHY